MKLQDWFIEKDYGLGLAILGQYCKNRILLQNLGRKPNPQKLEYELRKVATEQGIDLTAPVVEDEDVNLNLDEAGKVIDLATGKVQETQSDSDQLVDQMNADQNPKHVIALKDAADEIVSDKLGELESEAEDIVSTNVDELVSIANDIISGKVSEFESQVADIMAGKLEVVRDGRKVKFEDLSPEMQARWTQNKDAYKEIRSLHEKLKLMEKATPEDRAPLTARICKLDDMIRDNWVEIDAYSPASKESAAAALVIDHKRIGANRKFISTNLKKLPEQQDPVKAAIVVAELQKRYNELKAAGETVAPETIEELTKAGVKC